MVNTANLTKHSLQFGDSGPAVKELQTLLDNYSQFIKARAISPGAIDGKYEQKTLDVVQAFQKKAGLPKRSTVDDAFWFALS
jgi:peptidoglycan hydrolase-like protein with peptidoglycan-binding domain